MQQGRKRGHSSYHPPLNRSFKGSLAQENDVRNFNRQRNNRSMAPSHPHRIQLPLFFNTPNRTEVVQNATQITVLRRLKDYEMLAFGCHRAGKIRDEGRSYYSIGVLYDNVKNYRKGIEYYKKFLHVCKSISDTHGQALAYNCLGVNCQLLAQTPQAFQEAIEYHMQHEQLADVNGKFLASINLGLCYDKMGDAKNSVFHFQNALKHSIQMSNLSGQSVAIGNIGRIGTKDLSQNKDKMKIFVQKYLKLAEEMHDERGEAEGCLKLGMIASTKKNFNEGRENFKKALQLAENSGDKSLYDQAKLGYAVVSAERDMNNYLGYFSTKVGKRQEKNMYGQSFDRRINNGLINQTVV